MKVNFEKIFPKVVNYLLHNLSTNPLRLSSRGKNDLRPQSVRLICGQPRGNVRGQGKLGIGNVFDPLLCILFK